jgi:hypothetical protein
VRVTNSSESNLSSERSKAKWKVARLTFSRAWSALSLIMESIVTIASSPAIYGRFKIRQPEIDSMGRVRGMLSGGGAIVTGQAGLIVCRYRCCLRHPKEINNRSYQRSLCDPIRCADNCSLRKIKLMCKGWHDSCSTNW